MFNKFISEKHMFALLKAESKKPFNCYTRKSKEIAPELTLSVKHFEAETCFTVHSFRPK